MSTQAAGPAGARDYGRVALLLGGHSAERPISLKSGAEVLAALRRCGIDVQPLDTGGTRGEVLETLRSGDFQRAFIILHGCGGEDGQIQGALDTLGLRYTGSGVLGSAIGMDKYRTKLVWEGAGLPTAEFALIHDEGGLDRAAALGFPLMIKPAHEGSSLGMARADDRAGLAAAWREASRFDPVVLAERWLVGAEYTCAILGDRALPLIRLQTPHAFYDFEAKYQALCLRAFAAVGASGWGRVDFMLDAEGAPMLLEINTVPGMTDHSLVPMAARATGIAFDDLCLRILATSDERHADHD
ncbi:MAG: D-alanine--D-alanine ligase [Alphaproteobacteria bacterium]|jgi:D-alanine-D-alanine ligase|nr:D-alanine--D-alanine ligase [Alphaproteobacteria bacterium]